MDLMLFVEVLADIVLKFALLWVLYGVVFSFGKQELLVMAVALIIEAILQIILSSPLWAATWAVLAAYYFWRWKNKKPPETPTP